MIYNVGLLPQLRDVAPPTQEMFVVAVEQNVPLAINMQVWVPQQPAK